MGYSLSTVFTQVPRRELAVPEGDCVGTQSWAVFSHVVLTALSPPSLYSLGLACHMLAVHQNALQRIQP